MHLTVAQIMQSSRVFLIVIEDNMVVIIYLCIFANFLIPQMVGIFVTQINHLNHCLFFLYADCSSLIGHGEASWDNFCIVQALIDAYLTVAFALQIL